MPGSYENYVQSIRKKRKNQVFQIQFITWSVPEGHRPDFPSFWLGRASSLGLSDLCHLVTIKQEHGTTAGYKCVWCAEHRNDQVKILPRRELPFENWNGNCVWLYRRELLVPFSVALLWHPGQRGQWNLLAWFPPSLASLPLLANVMQKYFFWNVKVSPPGFRFPTSVPRQDLINRSSVSPNIWCAKQLSWARSGQRSQTLTMDERQVSHLPRGTYMHEGETLKTCSSWRVPIQWQDHFPGSRTPRPNKLPLTSASVRPTLPDTASLLDKSAGCVMCLPQQTQASPKSLRDLELALIMGISKGN